MTEATHLLAPAAVAAYLTAGKALVTLKNTESGNRQTYKVTAPGKTAEARENAEILFVSVLTGSDNTCFYNYSYIGIIIRATGEFKSTAKSRLPADDVRVKGFSWLMGNAHANTLDRFPHVEVRHHNRCGRCSRVLTVPESIDTGLGPICSRALGVEWATKTAA